MNSQILLKDLSFSYGNNTILKNLNFEISQDDYIAIIGPNGGGKTTLLKLLLGFLQPTEGEIKILGKPPLKARQTIGYLPQYINFNMDMPINVFDIVLQGRLTKDKLFYNDRDRELANEKLKLMNIEKLKNRKIKDLSGGQRQRVLLARALTKEPEILILDEPTASIDLEGQKEIYALLKKLPLTKLIVSHDINILFEGVNKVAHINKTLHLHDAVKHDKNITDGHFCEMELLDYFRNHKCSN
jgi:zinc transport system ATP-binding protein